MQAKWILMAIAGLGSCSPGVGNGPDPSPERHPAPGAQDGAIPMRRAWRRHGSAGRCLSGRVHQWGRKQPGNRAGERNVDDLCQHHFGFRCALCSGAIYLVGRGRRGQFLFRFAGRKNAIRLPPDERHVRKNLGNPGNREEIRSRLAGLTPQDARRWGLMSVHQMVCHLDDSYQLALGQKTAQPATNMVQKTLVKWVALRSPMRWPKGVPTRPEVGARKGRFTPGRFCLRILLPCCRRSRASARVCRCRRSPIRYFGQ